MTAADALYLFDIDGTLLRAGGAGGRALDAVFAARYGVSGAMAGIDAGGRTDPWLVAQAFERMGRRADDDEIAAVIAAYLPELERELAAGGPRFRVLDGVVEALDWLDGVPAVGVGLATGNVAAGARIKLDRAGLTARFGFGGYGCDSADRAVVVARAIERGVATAGTCIKERIVVVGDTVHDIAAARACRVRVVAVATGNSDRATLGAAAPDALLDSLAELPAWHQSQLAPASASERIQRR